MPAALALLLGCLLGAGCTLGHLAYLQHTLGLAEALDPEQAGRRIARALPLRLLLWTPALLGVAMMGLWACLGLAVGIALGRLVVVVRMVKFRERG